MRAFVTGASGYVGGRLVPRLRSAGFDVTAASRDPRRLRDLPWASDVQLVAADVTDEQQLTQVLAVDPPFDVAYYLVHSIDSGRRFDATDRLAAQTFARVAKAAGVRRIIYLGGLHPDGAEALSPHLRSRAEVGDILLASGVPTAVLQAAVVIGSGSASFEMLRHLVERLPVMVTPRWVHSRVQPIAIADVLHYLVAATRLPADVAGEFDIGGPEVLTYLEMMHRYARVAGLSRRLVVPVPLLTPTLSSYWVNLVTPVPAAIARPLVASLVNEVVARDSRLDALVGAPPGGCLPFDDAVRRALDRERALTVETRWSGADWPGVRGDLPEGRQPGDPDWAGATVYVDERTAESAAPASALWSVVRSIGGQRGWYSWPLAWELRGLADRLVGGVGLRRGRRHPTELRLGEALDFWRVEAIVPGRLLRLRAEMRLPGRAWLELEVTPADGGGSRYRQRAVFLPHGLFGHLYWWSVAPFHGVVFGQMARRVAAEAAHAPAVSPASGHPVG